MEDTVESSQADKIQELIRREKEEADQSFEGHRFEAQLVERIRRAGEARTMTWLAFLRKPGPIIAFSGLVLAAAGILLFRTSSPPPFPQTIRAMSTVLAEAADGRRTHEQDRLTDRITTAEFTDFGWALKGVLYACERQTLGDVGLTDAFSTVFLEGAARAASGRGRHDASSGTAESPKLSTGEDFEKFFSGFLKRLEEV